MCTSRSTWSFIFQRFLILDLGFPVYAPAHYWISIFMYNVALHSVKNVICKFWDRTTTYPVQLAILTNNYICKKLFRFLKVQSWHEIRPPCNFYRTKNFLPDFNNYIFNKEILENLANKYLAWADIWPFRKY